MYLHFAKWKMHRKILNDQSTALLDQLSDLAFYERHHCRCVIFNWIMNHIASKNTTIQNGNPPSLASLLRVADVSINFMPMKMARWPCSGLTSMVESIELCMGALGRSRLLPIMSDSADRFGGRGRPPAMLGVAQLLRCCPVVLKTKYSIWYRMYYVM